VKTPPNVRMISTPPPELAWMLSGVVLPADADEHPDLYVSDYQTAVKGRAQLEESQIRPRNARAMAARFIQTLLAKVRTCTRSIVGVKSTDRVKLSRGHRDKTAVSQCRFPCTSLVSSGPPAQADSYRMWRRGVGGTVSRRSFRRDIKSWHCLSQHRREPNSSNVPSSRDQD